MKYLRPRQHYEDRHDRMVVDICRTREKIMRDSYEEAKEHPPKLTGEDEGKDPEHELLRVMNFMHYFYVDQCAGELWEEREQTITEWMEKDKAKDRQLEEARLTKEPVCEHCGKTGLRLTSKDLMHRGDNYEDDNEDVLFMLRCPHCKKITAIWQDGTRWERHKTYCPKCKTIMDESSAQTKKLVTYTYNCPKCGHAYKDKLDLSITKEKPDPYYEEDKARFCLTEEQGQKYLAEKRNLEEMGKLVEDMKEREANKAAYDAARSLKRVNIGQLVETLRPMLETAGYGEIHIEKPNLGRNVTVEFSCLDNETDRGDYQSRKTLKKTVTNALRKTNWRLTSVAIEYRLGYLAGTLRAYENEEDLVELVKKDERLLDKFANKVENSKSGTFFTEDGKEIIL